MTSTFAWICAGLAAFGGVLAVVATLGAAYFFDKSAEEGIARADENAAHANKLAGQTHERAAELEKQAEELRKDNLKLTERLAWRNLPEAPKPEQPLPQSKPDATQAQKAEQSPAPSDLYPVEMLIITQSEMEAAKYGAQVVAAIRQLGIRVNNSTVGGVTPAIYGVKVAKDGWSTKAQAAVDKIGLHISPDKLPVMPIPGSIAGQFTGMPKLIVGVRPPP